MTCESALELMLDAEPSELDADGAAPLSAHLRGCTRCRRVATQLVRDTLLLANATRVAPVQRAVRRAVPTFVPAFALAGIVMVVMLRSRSGDAPTITPALLQHTVQAPAATIPARDPDPDAPTTRTRPTRVRRQTTRAFAPAVAVAPVRFEPSGARPPSAVVITSSVTVSPPPGTRAAVMQTSDPKLVVVWLY